MATQVCCPHCQRVFADSAVRYQRASRARYSAIANWLACVGLVMWAIYQFFFSVDESTDSRNQPDFCVEPALAARLMAARLRLRFDFHRNVIHATFPAALPCGAFIFIEYHPMTDVRHSEPAAISSLSKRRALRTIGLFEAIKGIAVLAGSIGLLSLVDRDVRHLAAELIGHLGMSPGAHYPSILLHYADALHDADLRWLLFLAVIYAAVRLLEAYGLWNDFAWAEWLGALSGALYFPFEIRHLVQLPSVIGAAVFAGNIFVVSFLAFQLSRRRKRRVRRP